jgi:hypothetical protein
MSSFDIGPVSPPPEGEEVRGIKRKLGTDIEGRTFIQIKESIHAIQEKIAELGRSGKTILEKSEILRSLEPHIQVLKSFQKMTGEAKAYGAALSRRARREGEQEEVDIPALLASVHAAHSDLEHEQSLQAEALRTSLKQALDDARRSGAPMEILTTAYKAVAPYYAADLRFRPFLRDIQLLMRSLQDKPEETKRLLIPLLEKVLFTPTLQGGLTPLEGSKFAARLLFIVDQEVLDSLPKPFAEAYDAIEELVSDVLDQFAAECKNDIKKYALHKLYTRSGCRATILPQAVAKAILREDGTVNVGITDLVKKAFLQPKASRDSVERHIDTKLKELQSNEALLSAIETIPAPIGTGGKMTINGILKRKADHPVTAVDARRTALSGLLTWWRQGSLGNCYAVSTAIQRQEIVSTWLIEDFKALLCGDGVILRSVNERIVPFFGLQWPQKIITGKPIKQEEAEEIFDLKAIKHACRELDCTTAQEFSQAIIDCKAKTMAQSATLLEVFQELAAKHGKTAEDVQKACWIAESPEQNLLLRQWENGLGSTLFSPIMETSVPTNVEFPNAYFCAILSAFSQIAEGIPLPRLAAILSTYPKFLTPTDSPLPLPLGALPPSLVRFRACLVPQAMHDLTELSWVVGQEQMGQFVPFHTRDEFALFLRQMLLEWAQATEQTIIEGQKVSIEAIPPLQIIELFENSLLKQKKTVKDTWGTIHGMFCYSMGGGTFGILEKTKCIYTGLTDLKLGENKSKAVKKLLTWMQAMRATYGDDPNLSFVGSTSEHMFRLLPNHPSIVEACSKQEDPVAAIEQNATKTISRPIYHPSYLTKKISEILKERAARFETESGVTKEKIYDSMVRLIDEKFMLMNKQKCSIRDFLVVAWSVLEETRNSCDPSHPFKENAETLFILRSLIEFRGPEYKDQLIHFADTNWQAIVRGKNQALHYCFWFDPVHRSWEVIDVTETGEVQSNIGKESQNFFEQLKVHTGIDPLSRELHQKKLLEFNRKTTVLLQKLERQFVESWQALKAETAVLKERGWQGVSMGVTPMEDDLPEGTEASEFPPVEDAPEQWLKLFNRCHEIREQYAEVVKSRIRKSASPQDEFRYTPPTGASLQHLMSTEQDFRYFVQELLRS